LDLIGMMMVRFGTGGSEVLWTMHRHPSRGTTERLRGSALSSDAVKNRPWVCRTGRVNSDGYHDQATKQSVEPHVLCIGSARTPAISFHWLLAQAGGRTYSQHLRQKASQHFQRTNVHPPKSHIEYSHAKMQSHQREVTWPPLEGPVP
jgi:hypothetical protein